MRGIQATSELDRILALDKRQGSTDDLVDALSAYLRKPHTCTEECTITRLHPLQAQALIEAHDHNGVFLQGPIGCGKTGVSLLLPTLFDARRPLLVVPGGAIMDQTVETLKAWRRHWDIRPITLQSYQFLTQAGNVDYLEQYNPDLIICDEIHRSKDPKRSVARRLKRFLTANPTVPFCCMSGTPAKRSIRDFAPALHHALRERTPLPIHQSDLLDWSLVLDAGVRPDQRINPGALARWYGQDIQHIRRGVRDRIFSTPGAIASDVSNVEAKLEITLRNVPLTPAEDLCYKALYDSMESPDGHMLFDAIQIWQHARQFACGFYSRWEPRAPEDWLEARKEWMACCREILAMSRKLDTEKAVALHIDAHPNHHATKVLARWRNIKNTFEPNPVPVWVGDTALCYAAQWLQDGGICWTDQVPFGRRLAQISGVRYFGAGGLTEDGQHSIVNHKGPSMIASIQACGVGLNLQAWHRGLLTSISPTATTYEQVLGRQHRQGQIAPVVCFDHLISCRENLAGWERASQDDANFLHDLLNVPSRLLGQPVRSDKITQTGYAWQALKR